MYSLHVKSGVRPRVRRVAEATLLQVEKICDRLNEINNGDVEGCIEPGSGPANIDRLVHRINRALDRGRKACRFASDVSHELRSPLAGLRARIEEVRLHGDPQIDLEELLHRELRDIDRLEAIIDDLLTLSRLQQDGPSRHRPFDLAALVKDDVARRDDRVPVQVRLEPGVFVGGVATQISRILTNLLDNGQRHVKTWIVVTVRRDGDMAEMAVEDDGDGVPPGDRERIFKRFARSEKSLRVDPQGAGLGLAITREIARAHGGTIHVEDSPTGGGARFVLRIPAIDPPE
ncbi:HAMP domain-containing histidine kinase [Sphaerisporangium sp. NBC_01403]|uniref:sensor histidine kinase n=1 Tax=Sphaerisporangium sp. NBC_01403 TaxID=2903599 RepID=UPI003251F3AA